MFAKILNLKQIKIKIMKSYADLEQSKRLAEILPLDSADLFLALNGTQPVMSKYIDDGFVPADNTAIPCWSLAALIGALPLGVDIIHNITDGHKMYYYVEIYTKEIYMKLKRMGKEEICLSTERHENLVDACVEMIFTLKEKDLL